MTVHRLAAVDAQNHWMAGIVPNDQFLMYVFAAPAADPAAAAREVLDRARRCPDLGVRISDGSRWTFPSWEPCAVDATAQVVLHEDPTWARCLATVAGLADAPLDTHVHCWRLHVFPAVRELPVTDTGCVVVLQISHALADGVRASALAARLFGRPGRIPAPVPAPRPVAAAARRGAAAARAHRRLVRDTAAGLVPGPASTRPALRTNAAPAGDRQVRVVVRHRDRIPGPTVTVGVLGAVAEALGGHLRALGDDVGQLGAEVPMAKTTARAANNHYANVGVGLYPDRERAERAHAIAGDLLARRRRAAHPALRAEEDAFAVVPPALLRWGVAHFDPAARFAQVSGNTVVSSVNRGPADLAFGGAPVVLTAGALALSPMMGLTHGVHGIGDAVAITVHAVASALGDSGGIDDYVDRLERALP